MKVKIINNSKNALPKYETSGSAGLDLRANISESIEIGSLERHLIPTGLHIELPVGYEAQVRPRSGLAVKKGITCMNSPGTIDSDYRGEIHVCLVNVSKEVFTVNPGDRIAQMVIGSYTQVNWEQVEVLGETERGSGGFGHTGV